MFLTWRKLNQANNSVVRPTVKNRECPEIFIPRDDDRLRPECVCQNFVVAWVFCPVADEINLMARESQPLRETASRASIKHKFHAPGSTKTGSTRSLPTIRCA